MNDQSSVRENHAGLGGGGIYSLGSITLNDQASVVSNTSEENGGGIYGRRLFDAPLITMNGDSSVSGNDAVDGGGIYVDNFHLVLSGASIITSNVASGSGGGVKFNGSSAGATIASGWTGSVSGNTPDQCDPETKIVGCT